MNYIEFRNTFLEMVCFSTQQIKNVYSNFNNNNLTRWVNKGLLVKLRNGYYSFPEYLHDSDSAFYIANRFYRPSYISLHTALAFYGIIPEGVFQITSVSTLKTAEYENLFGIFIYKKILPSLFFGYDQKKYSNSKVFLIAQPEKAILDLLYLYPFYKSVEEIENLRFDEDLMHEIINLERLSEYTKRFKNKALSQRIENLKTVFRLC